MNITESNKAANALGGKTARACDSCLIKRARWFCAADDAFLCQSCDSAVHSANQLASRHERVRLGTSSCKDAKDNSSGPAPSWHHGFTRKARTPRPSKSKLTPPANHQLPLVPEMNTAGEDSFLDEINEEQLLYTVPVFDPFGEEFCREDIAKGESLEGDDDHELNLAELLSNCDEKLADFAADVEGLLGIGAAEEIGNINVSEILDGKRSSVKVEDDDGDEVEAVIACHFDPALDMDMELNLDFDYATTSCVSGEEEMKMVGAVKTASDAVDDGGWDESRVEKRMLLRLNYEAVIAAWASQGSPWTDGVRPQFNLDDFMVACLEGDSNNPYAEFGGRSSSGGASDAGREARVSRYREKRRTRLFSKKIRYQVRKLNAEKRPRMKGRFVKRTTTFSGSSLPYLINQS